MEPALLTKREGPVGWIIINRPEKRNAITLEMWYTLQQLIAEFAHSDIRALVITGAGDVAFAAGADITEMGTTRGSQQAARASFLAVEEACRQLTELPVPVIAAINGYAVGAGLEIAVSCDYRIGTPQTRMGITASKMGIAVGHGHIRRIVAAVGASWALDLLLSGRLVAADEAVRTGLLHRVVDGHEALFREVQALGEMFVERAPGSVAWAKRVVREIRRLDR